MTKELYEALKNAPGFRAVLLEQEKYPEELLKALQLSFKAGRRLIYLDEGHDSCNAQKCFTAYLAHGKKAVEIMQLSKFRDYPARENHVIVSWNGLKNVHEMLKKEANEG